MKLVRMMMVALLLVGAGMAQALDWSGPTQAELALMPPYCEAKMNEQSPNRKYWSRQLGSAFGGIHHYCSGLKFMLRYYQSTGRDRDSLLKFALDGFNFTLKNPDPNSWITPEVYLSRGIALKLARRESEAVRDFHRAIELNPRFGKAYLELIDYFSENGQRAMALEIATQSLRYLPDAGILKKRYDELGGTQPYPEPVVERAQAQDSSAPDEEVAGAQGSEQEESGGAAVAAESDSVVTASPDEFPREDSKNPWCRFCTE